MLKNFGNEMRTSSIETQVAKLSKLLHFFCSFVLVSKIFWSKNSGEFFRFSLQLASNCLFCEVVSITFSHIFAKTFLAFVYLAVMLFCSILCRKWALWIASSTKLFSAFVQTFAKLFQKTRFKYSLKHYYNLRIGRKFKWYLYRVDHSRNNSPRSSCRTSSLRYISHCQILFRML